MNGRFVLVVGCLFAFSVFSVGYRREKKKGGQGMLVLLFIWSAFGQSGTSPYLGGLVIQKSTSPSPSPWGHAISPSRLGWVVTVATDDVTDQLQ